MGFDCRADRIAFKEEKFFSCLHSYNKTCRPQMNFCHIYSHDTNKLDIVCRQQLPSRNEICWGASVLTCATFIHFSITFALWTWGWLGHRVEAGLGLELAAWQRMEEMTWLVTALNWAMVARMVGERFSLSRWDQTQPKHWNGCTFTNSS